MHKIRKILLRTIVNTLICIFSISCIFPIIWTFYSSFKTKGEFLGNIIGLPKNPQFESYKVAMDLMNFWEKFGNSLFNSIISVFFIIIFATVIGYFLARYQFTGRTLLYFLFMIGMLVPIHGFLVPIYLQFKTLNFIDTRFTLIMPYIAFGLPVAIFLMESFIHSLPLEVEEAGIIDGANINRRLFRIVFPMCRPIISTILILSFLNVWNEFPFALVLLSEDKLRTLPVGLTVFKGQYQISYPNIMAGLMLTSIPIIIFYLLLSRRVTEGMVAGAVKG